MNKKKILIIANVQTRNALIDVFNRALKYFTAGEIGREELDRYWFMANVLAHTGIIFYSDYLKLTHFIYPEFFSNCFKNGLDVPYENTFVE